MHKIGNKKLLLRYWLLKETKEFQKLAIVNLIDLMMKKY